MGVPPVRLPPRILARNEVAVALTEAISWGSPPFSPSVRGPLYRWKNKGIYTVERPGVEEPAHILQVRRVMRTPALGFRVPWRQRTASPGLQASCGGQSGMATV